MTAARALPAVLILATSFLLIGNTAHGAVVYLAFSSPSAASVGRGETRDLKYVSEVGDTIQTQIRQQIDDQPASISVRFFHPGAEDLGTIVIESLELGTPLQIGTFPDAVRGPALVAGDQLGFDFGFDGRGNNTHDAWVQITELAFEGSGTEQELTRLALNFEQQKPTDPAPLTGTFFFSSVTAIPEPPSAMACTALFGALVLQRRRRSSAS